MRHLECWLLVAAIIPVLYQGNPRLTRQGFHKAPDNIVRSLYNQVISRHPLGIPSGTDKSIFEAYLSKALIQKMEIAQSCQNDWLKEHNKQMSEKNVPEKAPFAWRELGVFSGDEELAEPTSFQIEKVESKQDGSSLVYVKLIESPANDEPWSWEVAVQMGIHQERPVVDDVIYLKGDHVPTESRLSEVLATGCKAHTR